MESLLCIHLTGDISKKFGRRTGIDPALCVLQTEAFTTQLSRQIAEESPIWNDLMFLFKDNLMSDETPYHLSFSALFVSASVQ